MPGFDEGLTLRSSGGSLTSPTALGLACHMFVRLHGFVRGAVQRSIDVSSQTAAVESSRVTGGGGGDDASASDRRAGEESVFAFVHGLSWCRLRKIRNDELPIR